MAGLSDLNNRKILLIATALFVALVVLIILVNLWVRRSLQDIQNQVAAPPVAAVQPVPQPAPKPAAEVTAPAPVRENKPSENKPEAAEETEVVREAPITTKILNE